MVLIGVLLWIVLLWFLVGLCHAAQVGDGQGRTAETTSPAHDASGAAPAGQLEGEPASDAAALAA